MGASGSRRWGAEMINEFQVKQEICEIGQRIYAKGFAAANDGNITVKISIYTIIIKYPAWNIIMLS